MLEMNHAKQGAVIIHFRRRHPKTGWTGLRAMVGTISPAIINTGRAKMAMNKKGLGWTEPKYTKHSQAWYATMKRKNNLVCLWDIFKADWRLIPMESCWLSGTISGHFDPEQPEAPSCFWNVFDNWFRYLTPYQKDNYMNA